MTKQDMIQALELEVSILDAQAESAAARRTEYFRSGSVASVYYCNGLHDARKDSALRLRVLLDKLRVEAAV